MTNEAGVRRVKGCASDSRRLRSPRWEKDQLFLRKSQRLSVDGGFLERRHGKDIPLDLPWSPVRSGVVARPR